MRLISKILENHKYVFLEGFHDSTERRVCTQYFLIFVQTDTLVYITQTVQPLEHAACPALLPIITFGLYYQSIVIPHFEP